MATFVSQYSSTGFYKAPVSKAFLGSLFITCTAINVPLLSHLRKYLVCRLPQAILSGEVWRIFTAQLAFLDTKDLICGSLLIYYFRVFERRFGSQRFASYLLSTGLLSLTLQVAVILMLQNLDVELYGEGQLPPGPYGLIFPLFVPYFFDIPHVTQTRILGVPISGKTLTYLVGLQVCSTSVATSVSALCSIIAGFLYRWNFVRIQQWFRIPHWLAKGFDVTLGKLLASSQPNDGPMGATLELQRQEQIERLEQQMMLQRYRDARRPDNRPGFGMPWQNPLGDNFPRRRGDGQQDNRNGNLFRAEPAVEPTEENIVFLMEMGFSRDRVHQALVRTGNNVEAATNMLLQS